MLEVTHIVVGANASSILGVDTEDAEVEYFKIHNSEAMAISKIWIILFFGPKTTATICCPGPFLWKS